MAFVLLLLSAAALLSVSSSAASSPSVTLQELTERLSAACRQDAGVFDAYQEIISGQEVLKELLDDLQAQVTPVPEQCPDGWGRHEDSCFLIPPYKSSWSGAQHHCAALDRRARLASVLPSALQYVRSLVAAASSATGVWVGLTKLESGAWAWSDGSKAVMAAADWSPGEPSGDGICGHFFGPADRADRDRYNDRNCNIALNFLCQITLT